MNQCSVMDWSKKCVCYSYEYIFASNILWSAVRSNALGQVILDSSINDARNWYSIWFPWWASVLCKKEVRLSYWAEFLSIKATFDAMIDTSLTLRHSLPPLSLSGDPFFLIFFCLKKERAEITSGVTS
jgi:hypothetical protein